MSQQLSIDLIQNRLKQHAASLLSESVYPRQAAVALLLRESKQKEVDILFIRRAERAGDPWSGHMAFPGGHMEDADQNLKNAAIRETQEEIGIDLEHVEYLGELDHLSANPVGRNLNMLIAPHVFVLHEPQREDLNYEVAETVWTPLMPIFTGDNHVQEDRHVGGQPTPYAGYRITGQHFVWGLTYRMLHSFCGVIDSNWLPPD
ncbi:MAG: CoA pyrophosphatase [Pseudomonadales bacterium]|nr:CoA pyrophosphatase [Pseudomonadales bacterium]